MIIVLILIAVFASLSNVPLLITTSILAYTLIIHLFWKDGEPKIIVYGLSMFWLSVSIKLFYAVFIGVPYESLSGVPNIVETTYSALFSFVCYSLGIYVVTRKIRERAVVDFSKDYGYSVKRILIVFAGSIFVLSVLKQSIGIINGLQQIMFSLIDLKMGFLFLLLYPVFKRKDSIPFVIALLSIEIILSFFSFFSSFKDILFSVFIVLLTPRLKLTFRNVVAYSSIIIITLYMLFTWQFIKGEYRQFLNKGAKSQSIEVTQSEALDKLQELAFEKENEADDKLLYSSIDRLSYIEFYSEAKMRVPVFIPYENGKLWANNLAHIFLPRMFFPDKAIIDDSQMVNKYCIRKVATAKTGTSWSLGFIAESYIDFGPVLMYLIVFLVGCFMGSIYYLILKQSINYFWGYTMVLGLATKIASNGTPGTKLLGWTITYYFAFYIFKRLLMKPLDRYLRTGNFK